MRLNQAVDSRDPEALQDLAELVAERVDPRALVRRQGLRRRTPTAVSDSYTSEPSAVTLALPRSGPKRGSLRESGGTP